MKTILIVDGDRQGLAAAQSALAQSYHVIPAETGDQALACLQENEGCDVILLSAALPGADSFAVLAAMRELAPCADTPVIFLTADGNADTQTRCYQAGAADVIVTPVAPQLLLARVDRVAEVKELHRTLAQKTKEVAEIRNKYQQDALTGLWDRVYTEKAVNELLENGAPGALLMADIDNFKFVNDQYGHATGDKLLSLVADTLRQLCHEGDVLCRLGGDEFVVFFKDVSSRFLVKERVAELVNLAYKRMQAMGLTTAPVPSLSVGVALAPEHGTSFQRLYSNADKALYHVKRNGKNAYHFFGDRSVEENERSKETIDLAYLQELMGRGDDGNGAYLLELDNFNHVYNFLRRFADRSHRAVSLLLFTLADGPNELVMNALEKTVCTYMRRSDVTVRYSNKQLVAVLMDTANEDCRRAAERILELFFSSCPLEGVRVDYNYAHISALPGKAGGAPRG